MTTESKYQIREIELAIKVGMSRIEMGKLRGRLTKGDHWDYDGRPKSVWYTHAGVQAMERILGEQPAEIKPVVVEIEVFEEVEGHRYPDDKIPKLPQNGLILEHGRPGWWTKDEAKVLANKFANRKAISVEFEGRQTICRVKDSLNFQPNMIIPVRKYDGILTAARQPRFPGKW